MCLRPSNGYCTWYCDMIKCAFFCTDPGFEYENFIYVSQNVCGATRGMPININFNEGMGLKVSPKNAGSLFSVLVHWVGKEPLAPQWLL